MDEATVSKTMYESVEAVRGLNSVEGFDPRNYMREILGEGDVKKYYLDVAFRKLWFRLKYPEGRISKRLLKLADNMAVIEARVYLNYKDAEENYVSNAFSHKFRVEDAKFGNKFVELAETAAAGRALADAGFGLQFADCEKETDPEVADAPLESRYLSGGTGFAEMAGAMDDAGTVMEEAGIPGQCQIEDYIPAPGGQIPPAMQQEAAPAQPVAGFAMPPQPMVNASAPVAQPAAMAAPVPAAQPVAAPATPVPAASSAGKPYAPPANTGITPQQLIAQIDRKLPAEQIYSMLTRESAAAVVVNVGYSKGKTLGQVAIEKPGSLEWYVTQYNGPDNLLRAAAKFLLDSALPKAG